MERWPAEWRRSVLKDHRINNFTRVVLMVMAEEMDDDGRVSLSGNQVGRMLDVDRSRVTKAVQQGLDAGLLTVLAKGGPGRTSTYAARRSDGEPLVTKRRPSRGDIRLTMSDGPLGANTAPSDGEPERTKPSEDSVEIHAQHGEPEVTPNTEPQQSSANQTVCSSVPSGTANQSKPLSQGFGFSSPCEPSQPDAYDKARAVFDSLGPLKQDALMKQAAETVECADYRELIIAAARIASAA